MIRTRPIILFIILVVFALTACEKNVKKTYHDNGKLSAVLRYRNGLLHGHCEWYYANGNPMMRAEYRDNMLNGKQERFYENGLLQSVAFYTDNKLDSVMIHYNLNGKVILEEHYRNDTLHGPYRRFYDDGALFVEGQYQQGLMDGGWLFYSADGKVIGKGDFNRGNGIQKAWYPNGTVQRIIHYHNNVKHGPEEHFKPDGTLVLRRMFDNGQMVDEQQFN